MPQWSGAGLNDHQIVVSCVAPVLSLTDVLIVSRHDQREVLELVATSITLNLNGVPNAQRLVLEFRGVTDGVNRQLPQSGQFSLSGYSGSGSVNGTMLARSNCNQAGSLGFELPQ